LFVLGLQNPVSGCLGYAQTPKGSMKSKMARRLIAKCKWLSNVGEPPTLHRLRVMQKFQAASNHANKAACVAKRSGEAKTSEAKTSRSCPTKRQPENKKLVFRLPLHRNSITKY